jgi:putative phosphoesterase
MVRILLIGDSHIPRRASMVPDEVYTEINKQIVNNRFDYTLFTGDLIDAPKLLNFLNNITKKEVFKVIGNMDYYGGNKSLPQSQYLPILLSNNKKVSIGLIHGHQVHPRGDRDQLESIALENGFNILVSGHTHNEEIFLTRNGILLLNPGSITGAWSFVASGNCSFIVLKIEEESLNILVKLFQYRRKDSLFTISESNYQLVGSSIKKS